MRSTPWLLCAFALLLPLKTLAQETAEDPDLEEESSSSVQWGGMVQTQLNTSNASGAQDRIDVLLRRVRLNADARVNEQLSGRIQAELANVAIGGDAQLNEAYLLYEPSPNLGILIGKGGRPYGILDGIPAAQLLPIERGARFRGAEAVELYRVHEVLAYAGRSVGAQVLGSFGPKDLRVDYAAGYFTGSQGEEGASADIDQLAARAQVTFAQAVQVGVAVSSRSFGEQDRPGVAPDGSVSGSAPRGNTERGEGVTLDVRMGQFGAPGWHAMIAGALGTIDPFEGHTYYGATGWFGYLFALPHRTFRGLEPFVRSNVAFVQGPLSQQDGVLLTPGLNLYLPKGARFAINADLFRFHDQGTWISSFKAQAQLVF